MTEIQQVITTLHDQFTLKVLGFVMSCFLGFEVHRSNESITLTQQNYARDLLTTTQLLDSKPQRTLMCSTSESFPKIDTPMQNPTMYRGVIGALQYFTMTRPDITFHMNRLSLFMQSLTFNHWSACKHVLRYLAGTFDMGLTSNVAYSLNLQGFIDADWAGCYDDRKSTSGYCIFICGNLISWCSKKQTVIARSST
ncbi:hypothetical protein CsatB_024185 [Cannabis sativa]